MRLPTSSVITHFQRGLGEPVIPYCITDWPGQGGGSVDCTTPSAVLHDGDLKVWKGYLTVNGVTLSSHPKLAAGLEALEPHENEAKLRHSIYRARNFKLHLHDTSDERVHLFPECKSFCLYLAKRTPIIGADRSVSRYPRRSQHPQNIHRLPHLSTHTYCRHSS